MATVQLTSETVKKMSDYVAAAQPLIEKWAKLEAALSTRLPQVIDLLVQQNVINQHLKSAKVTEILSDPSGLVDMLEKAAAQITVKPAGGPAEDPRRFARGGKPESSRVFEEILMGNHE